MEKGISASPAQNIWSAIDKQELSACEWPTVHVQTYREGGCPQLQEHMRIKKIKICLFKK